MNGRRVLSLVLLSSGGGLCVVWGSAALADGLGRELGQRLGEQFQELSAFATTVEQAPLDEEGSSGRAEVEGVSAPQAVNLAQTRPDQSRAGSKSKKATSASKHRAAARVRKTHGTVFVSANEVLRLANARVYPRGVSVPSKGARPAGIALRGIGRLGIGLRDGDVLTHVSGRRVKTSEDVVTLVLGLRGRQVARINAVFWRAGKPWRLIVEQPYLQGVEP